MNSLEDALTETMTRHAGLAPVPPADLSHRVAVKHRRRRMARVTGAVTSAALVAAGLTFGVQQLGSHGGKKQPLSPAQKTTTRSEPIEKQWPQAVRRISNRLADGTRFVPFDYVDDRTLLIAVWGKGSVAKSLLTYDVDNGHTVKLDFPAPAANVTRTEGFTVGSGRVAWLSKTKKVTDIWSAPLTGGPATKAQSLAVAEPADIWPLTLADGFLYWGASGGGVAKAPAAGGPRVLLPGSDGLQLLSWPWAGGPAYSDGGSAMAADAPHQAAYKDIRNLVTGERRTAEGLPPAGRWVCHITWCLDERQARSRDGRRVVTPAPGTSFQGVSFGLALDRFTTMAADVGADMAKVGTVTIVDLETGKGGSYPMREDAYGSYSSAQLRDTRLAYQEYDKSYLLIDLTKIK